MAKAPITIIGDQTGVDAIRLKDHLARSGFDESKVTIERNGATVSVKETGQKFHYFDLSPFVVKFSWHEMPWGAAFHESYGALVEDALIVEFTKSEKFKELEEDDSFCGDYFRSDHELPVVLINEVKYRLVAGLIDNVLDSFAEAELPYFYFIESGSLSLCLKRHEYTAIDLGTVLTLQPGERGWTIHCDVPDFIEELTNENED